MSKRMKGAGWLLGASGWILLGVIVGLGAEPGAGSWWQPGAPASGGTVTSGHAATESREPGGRAASRYGAAETREAPSTGLYSIVDPEWASASLWNDGRAELDLYDARLDREFTLRDDAYVVHVVVKETFTPEYLVKADDWRAPDTFDVLKLNDISHVRTGLYDWNETTSVFLDRSRQVPIKATYGRQDWCGNLFKEWRRWRDQRWLSVSSYFDGTGTQRTELPLEDDVVPHDALPLLLRALRFDELEPGTSVRFPLLPSLRGAGAGPTDVTSAALTVDGEVDLSVPAGEFRAAKLTLRYPGVRGEEVAETYWIEARSPHRILQLHGSRGEALQLVRSERVAYWEKGGPGEPWYPRRVVREFLETEQPGS